MHYITFPNKNYIASFHFLKDSNSKCASQGKGIWGFEIHIFKLVVRVAQPLKMKQYFRLEKKACSVTLFPIDIWICISLKEMHI